LPGIAGSRWLISEIISRGWTEKAKEQAAWANLSLIFSFFFGLRLW
jgi:hypothetical protein